MPNVAILPTPLARAAAASTNPRNGDTCGIYDIAGRLGQAHRRPAYVTGTINALIQEKGFPRPWPLMKSGRLSDDAHADSRWARGLVEAWFDNAVPPEARVHADRADRAAIDSRLAVSAARLFDEAAA